MGLIDQIIGVESGGNANAKNPNSTATGLGQFVAGTWLDTIKATRPDLAEGKSDAELLALRSDPNLSREMTEAYAAQNGAILSKSGHPVTPGTTYLAHFAGPQGAVGVLSADPSTPIERVLTPAAIKANPFLQGMTAGDLRTWADRKMGGADIAPDGPTGLLRPAAPAGLLAAAETRSPWPFRTMNVGGYDMPQVGVPKEWKLPSAPPANPPPATPAPNLPQSAAPQQDIFAQMTPPASMQPIFVPQRRMPDLTKLRAAFQPPTFFRG